MIRVLVLIASFLLSSPGYGKDFNYKTTYWFQSIDLECKQWFCDVHINGNYKGKYGYEMMDDNTVKAQYNDYVIHLNLNTGDFKFNRKK